MRSQLEHGTSCSGIKSVDSDSYYPIDGYFLIKPEDLARRATNMMKIPKHRWIELD